MNTAIADRAVASHPGLRKIGVWGHYHGGNQGDELVVDTLIAHIRARRPGAEIVGFSLNPTDTRQRHGIAAYPIRWSASRAGPRRDARSTSTEDSDAARGGFLAGVKAFLKRIPWLAGFLRGLRDALRGAVDAAAAIVMEPLFILKSYRMLKGFDMLIVAGSGPVFDGWGPWHHPYSIFKWSVLSKLRGTKFVFLCVGAGPIDARLSRWFFGTALRMAHYRSYRDAYSANLVKKLLKVPGEHPVFPDMAFSSDLAALPAPPTAFKLPRGRMVVGLNPIPYHDGRYTPRQDSPKYDAYVHKVAQFARWLIENDYAIMLVYSQLNADRRVNEDLKRQLAASGDLDLGARLVEPEIRNTTDLIACLRRCNCVVAGRFHCIVIPYLLGIPAMGFAYHPKTQELMKYLGEPAYSLGIEEFSTQQLIERFQRLQQDRARIQEEIPTRLPALREALLEQYDRVLGARAAAPRATMVLQT